MFFFDPLYLIVIIVGMFLVIVPQMYVVGTYKKYLKVPSKSGLTGAEVVAEILRYKGYGTTTELSGGKKRSGIKVEAISGALADHYDPTRNVIRLSEENYYGKSIAAIAVAAHEAGHAIQENEGYIPIKFRSAFFPIASFGDRLGVFLLMIGLVFMFLLGMPGLGQLVAIAGIALYFAVVLFQFITLPVEFNASSRALGLLRTTGIVSDSEVGVARKVLTAAALTYVATALYALINLLYYVYLFFGRRD